MDPFSVVVGCFAGIAFVVFPLILCMVIRPWLRMKTCGGNGSFLYLLSMRFRGNPVSLIIDAYIGLLHSGAIVTLRDVESHFVANQSRIMTAADLMNSILENPVDTHVAVWLESSDAKWLGTYFAARADAQCEEQESDNRSSLEASRYGRIAERANSAVHGAK